MMSDIHLIVSQMRANRDVDEVGGEQMEVAGG